MELGRIVKEGSMKITDKICEKARDLPEPLAREVLAFIERIHAQRDVSLEELKRGQVQVMNRIWQNEEDEVWNEL
jgi:hypothetical protein